MARNTSISLGEHFAEFIDARLREGRYGSASEVVRAGLRLLEDHEVKARALREALTEGEKSGRPKSLDAETFLKRMRTRHAR